MNNLRLAFFLGLLLLYSGCRLSEDSPDFSRLTGKASPIIQVHPFPLEYVQLSEGPFLHAVQLNSDYLLRLEPDRLLHNFRENAGLEPKAEAYGGWEQDTIAGHSLGHYLTACSLMYAQIGDTRFKQRVDSIVEELTVCQEAARDGYIAGFPNGRKVFEEIKSGDIRAKGFDLNGIWVPFYNWHKLLNGLLDAQNYCGNEDAVEIARGLADFIIGIFEPLNEEQVQQVLACEHGGINESMANLFAVTGDSRYMNLAKRIYHRAVLDPLAERRDDLAGKHANTQIPKVIGTARIHELSGEERFGTISRFFWDTVLLNHTFVIGGNADREYFQDPMTISRNITEQTCESCNTYNMLKLTRHLFSWSGNSRYFDYYERALYNHILGQQHPETGMFCYMIPLRTGSARSYSTPFDSFWCCVGTGMENHSKYGDSIYFHDSGDGLYINLFIPSVLNWREKGLRIEQVTEFPYENTARFKFAAQDPVHLKVKVRKPKWAEEAVRITLNGEVVEAESTPSGYLEIESDWNDGDLLEFSLPLKLRIEPTPDDPQKVAILYGPIVLAADLGPASENFDGTFPALVAEDVLSRIELIDSETLTFSTNDLIQPKDIPLKPFYSLHDRRYGVYWDRFNPDQWKEYQRKAKTDQHQQELLDARSVDIVVLGDEDSEKEHGLTSEISYPSTYRGVPCRDARSSGFFSFEARVDPDRKNILMARYWGGERNRKFDIQVDGETIATQTLDGESPGEFIHVNYEMPERLTSGKNRIRVRFQPAPDRTAGPVFGCRILFSEQD